MELGKKAPAFSLKDKDGTTYSLNKLEHDYIIVYFYPRDSTPGCTTESLEFEKHLKKLQKLDAQVIGISGGDEKSKSKFCDKYGFTFPLLSDTDFKVSTKYGCYGEKKFMGKTHMGIMRKTFILDAEKRIIKIYHKVKPAEHAEEVLAFIKDNAK